MQGVPKGLPASHRQEGQEAKHHSQEQRSGLLVAGVAIETS